RLLERSLGERQALVARELDGLAFALRGGRLVGKVPEDGVLAGTLEEVVSDVDRHDVRREARDGREIYLSCHASHPPQGVYCSSESHSLLRSAADISLISVAVVMDLGGASLVVAPVAWAARLLAPASRDLAPAGVVSPASARSRRSFCA